jgi:hypothetical protein
MAFKSLIFVTLYTEIFLLNLLYTDPTPKKDWILYKISASSVCRFISNEDLTFHFKGFVISIIMEKQASPSVKPAILLNTLKL